MERDAIWRLLDDVQGQIRLFDTKAQVALGIDGILAGFLGTQLLKVAGDWASEPLTPLVVALVLLTLCFGCLIVSFMYALRTINPQLELDQPRSHFFFGHIAERHGRDFDSAARDLRFATEEKIVHDLATQVSVNSFICDTKARRCKKALLATGIAIAFYLVTLIPLSIAAFEDGVEHRSRPTPSIPRYRQITGLGAERTLVVPGDHVICSARKRTRFGC
jgi:hypothetical protein